MRYPSISEQLSGFLSDKNIIREVKESSRIISFAAKVDSILNISIDNMQKHFKNLFSFNRPSEEYSFIAAGELTSITENGIGRFHAIDKKLKQVSNKVISNWINTDLRVPLFTGGMKFTIEHNDPDWKDFSDSNWIIPEIIFLSDKGKNFLVYNFYFTRSQDISSIIEEMEHRMEHFLSTSENSDSKIPRILSTSGNAPKDKKKWKNMVHKALEEIYDDKLKKVVLSRKVEIKFTQETPYNHLLKNLQTSFPECAVFLFKLGSSSFFGATPEKLFSLENNKLLIDALAGSARNSDNTSVLFSEKNIKEHDFVLKHIKNTIAPFSDKVNDLRYHDTKKLNNISHIWSEISAELNDGNPVFLVIKELFPTPAVCGTPKEAALNAIKKLEEHRRGLYSGIVGWFNFSNAEFHVAIRSALSCGNKLTAYAGCGIVEGSDPEEEFDETELKLIPILSLLRMKIKVNRNILWAETFFKNLANAGVKYSCISPGSRSTPLTYSAAINTDIKSYVHIDERSAAFFATGLARKSKTPVVLICTSGTAAAEFYPGIIEAYQQRIPLIVCTADRPDGSFLKGLNQTINQDNIFKNHIRWFYDAGLPDLNRLNEFSRASVEAVQKSISLQGPVHINFPFDKPFEPENSTDEIDEQDFSTEFIIPEVKNIVHRETIENVSDEIISEANGLITVGPSAFTPLFRQAIINLSKISGYPVFADGASQLRFGTEIHPNIITNYDTLFRSGFFGNSRPGIILHFGRTMTSKGYDDFLMKYNGKKILVNKFNETFDPSGRYNALINSDEEIFVNTLSEYLDARGFVRKNSTWEEKIQKSETLLCNLKLKTVSSSPFPDESRIITELISLLPENWNLMLSNSSPVRDFDYFSGQLPRKVNVFHNRGASGIDGISSTALGIAAESGNTVLLTGDLAFYHDMNGLLASSQYKIPLIIILINNNGGGIFKALPVSDYKEIFSKFFTTPHDLNFRNFIEGFRGIHKEIKDWEDFRNTFMEALEEKKLYVMEIKTDAELSLSNRRKFWNLAEGILNDNTPL